VEFLPFQKNHFPHERLAINQKPLREQFCNLRKKIEDISAEEKARISAPHPISTTPVHEPKRDGDPSLRLTI